MADAAATAATDIVSRLQAQIKDGLKSGDAERAGMARLLLAAVKQDQIDSGTPVDDARLLTIVEKMIKQRRESIRHFKDAGRDDLTAKEQSELEYLQTYMPAAMSEDELTALLQQTIQACAATSPKDMGRVMAQLKPQIAGRADMRAVSEQVKKLLT